MDLRAEGKQKGQRPTVSRGNIDVVAKRDESEQRVERDV